MPIWMSAAFRDSLRLDGECRKASAADKAGHGAMVSTVLGMLDVMTTAQDAGLDPVGPWRRVTR
ncbi:hypothetical protein [Tabrizicola sp.]|jgi:lipid A ethanolaminephosphotransferase|uniref:hypothetical protein n=1 Tax=Tabrizicola sp. TaxID=2005166 RepID=UPI0025D430B4|nr:hypothetical protein [Tabrizicola sp.]MBY0352431.1 hypothetical protein [Tabrizicola sp.]